MITHQAKIKDTAGSAFALLELICAFAIFAAVITATMLIVHACTKRNKVTIEYASALATAESRIEIIRDQVSSGKDIKGAALSIPSDEQLAQLRDGDVRVVVEDYGEEPSGLKLVKVIVSWKSGKRELSVRLSTLWYEE